VIARRPGAGGDRVEQPEIRDWNKDEFVGPLRPPDPRRGDGREAGTGGFNQLSSVHDNFLPVAESCD
jgi:hypothetical protein